MKESKNIYPKTIGEAVNRILSKTHDGLKITIMRSAEEEFASKFNVGLGACIRKDFGLWDNKNPELLRDCTSENIDPDEASKMILKALWKRVRDKEKKQQASMKAKFN